MDGKVCPFIFTSYLIDTVYSQYTVNLSVTYLCTSTTVQYSGNFSLPPVVLVDAVQNRVHVVGISCMLSKKSNQILDNKIKSEGREKTT